VRIKILANQPDITVLLRYYREVEDFVVFFFWYFRTD